MLLSSGSSWLNDPYYPRPDLKGNKEDVALWNTFKETYLEASKTSLADTLDGSPEEFIAAVEKGRTEVEALWRANLVGKFYGRNRALRVGIMSLHPMEKSRLILLLVIWFISRVLKLGLPPISSGMAPIMPISSASYPSFLQENHPPASIITIFIKRSVRISINDLGFVSRFWALSVVIRASDVNISDFRVLTLTRHQFIHCTPAIFAKDFIITILGSTSLGFGNFDFDWG